MTLTELRYIVAVAKEKQFCKAAKACYVRCRRLDDAIETLGNSEVYTKFHFRTISLYLLGDLPLRGIYGYSRLIYKDWL